jgi:hypothetical protein
MARAAAPDNGLVCVVAMGAFSLSADCPQSIVKSSGNAVRRSSGRPLTSAILAPAAIGGPGESEEIAMSHMLDPTVLVPLLSAMVLLLSLAKATVYLIICVVGLFSRDRRRRDDARRLLRIIARAPRDRPPRS